MSRSVFIPIIAMLLLCVVAQGQTQSQTVRPAPPNPSNTFPESVDQDINLPDEMRARMIIARLEDEHKKFLEDVMKLDELSSEVTRTYKERSLLSSEDLKKLESMEKLAKRILSHAGGNQVGGEDDKTANLQVGEAIDKIGAAVADIKKTALTETRHVVSAAVIGNSNEIIDLTRAIRRYYKQKD